MESVSIKVHLDIRVSHVSSWNLVNHLGNISEQVVDVQSWEILLLGPLIPSKESIGIEIKLKIRRNLT